MNKYEMKAQFIRAGGTLPVDDNSYDPTADLRAHSHAVKAAEYRPRTELSKEDIQELRKIQSERYEISNRRALGLDVPKEFGVRTEKVKQELYFDSY